MEKIKKILMTKDGKKFYVKDTTKDYHSQFGVVKAADLKKKRVKTNTGKEMYCYKPSFNDIYRKIRRGAQIIPLKDVSTIMAEAAITNKSIVVDAGVGSGALSLFMALHAKHVYSYEIRDDHLEISEHNKKMLGIKNCTIEKHSIYDGIKIRNVDAITLDVPEPWLVVDHADKALKQGGYLISYSPCIPQTADFVNAIHEHKNFIHLKTIEVGEKEWEVEGRKVRPKTRAIGHSGFISVCRKV
jgi:tRNA (adenine57-N1/adenine58-N1)-methyltransferase